MTLLLGLTVKSSLYTVLIFSILAIWFINLIQRALGGMGVTSHTFIFHEHTGWARPFLNKTYVVGTQKDGSFEQPKHTCMLKLMRKKPVALLWYCFFSKSELTLSLPVSSADNLCIQFGHRSGPTTCQAWSGSKLFDTQIIYLKKNKNWQWQFWKKSADD